MVTAAHVARTLGGERVLRRRTPSFEQLREELRRGLPYMALETVASGFRITPEDIRVVLHLPARTLARRRKERRLRADESDRLFRMSRVAALAEQVLGSRESAAAWLHRPNRALGNAAPLRQLDTDLGARQVEDVLLRIAHGVHS
jgi:putative toxin-antitoxin system antitoxin component (TIGR02293 family)